MNATVESIHNRQSVKLVTAPGPTDKELDLILKAAMAAPDHGALRPWRFKIVKGEAIKKFAKVGIDLKQASDLPFKEGKLESTKAWLDEVPLIITVACHIDYSNTRIPETERMLATGAAVTNMLNTAFALGYGAFWSTGLATYIDEFQTAMGFDALDYRFMGFLVIGTPKRAFKNKERPDYHEFVEDWTDPL